MGLQDRPGLWVGNGAELGDRLLGAPEAGMTAPRSHLITKPEIPDPVPGALLPAMQHLLDRVSGLEHRNADLTRRVAALEQTWVQRLRIWWARIWGRA